MLKKQRSALEAPKVSPLKTKALSIAKWAPLAVAGSLVLLGAGAFGLAHLGQDDDRRQVILMVEQREAAADAAETSLAESLAAVLADASPESPQVIAAEIEQGKVLLADALAGKAPEALAEGFSGRQGAIETVTPVLVSSENDVRAYELSFTSTTGAAGLLGYTASRDAALSELSITWATGAPAMSDPTP